MDKQLDKIYDQDVVLYGAGKYGRQALENIRKYYPQMKIKYFIDDNRVRNREAVDGIEIVSLTEAMQKLSDDFYVLITNYYVSEVLKKIEAAQFDLKRVLFSSALLIEDVEPAYIEEHREALEQTYEMLGDYESKMIYRTMLESRFTKNIDVLTRTYKHRQYFPVEDILEIGSEEVFVDAGAFDGDTIKDFLEITGGHCQYIYAFEPDAANCERLRERNYAENVKIFNAGLFDKTDTLSFSANKGGSSKIESSGTEKIEVLRFDELDLPDKKVTFVKMDIEGSELKALEGMQEIIKANKPKLAICIYHKLEDLWEIPGLIKELVPEYKLYIRNYTTYLDEIVLYATL